MLNGKRNVRSKERRQLIHLCFRRSPKLLIIAAVTEGCLWQCTGSTDWLMTSITQVPHMSVYRQPHSSTDQSVRVLMYLHDRGTIRRHVYVYIMHSAVFRDLVADPPSCNILLAIHTSGCQSLTVGRNSTVGYTQRRRSWGLRGS